VAWILLDAFSQVCSENYKETTEQNGLKNLRLAEKRSSTGKVEAKGTVAAQI
jgi:hypothetical protein